MKSREIICTTILSVLVYFAFSPQTRAACGSPDLGCPGANLAEGYLALAGLTTGTYNTGIGTFSLLSLTDGNFNTGIGAGTLLLNTAAENTATGAAALLSNTAGTENTANGAFALFNNSQGSNNVAVGFQTLSSNTIGGQNTAIGANALHSNTTAPSNTAMGWQALFNNEIGVSNTAIGSQALAGNLDGYQNSAIGDQALSGNSSGGQNTVIGYHAASNITTGSMNVVMGGTNIAGSIAGEEIRTADNVICIGSGNPGANISGSCFISNILGVAVTGIPVVINGFGQLGTMTSSARFKDEIKPMDKASEAILALKPVTFRYKKEIDTKGIPQFGLVAEHVAKVDPDLVIRDADGKPYTVRYEAVNAMLLNEFLKEHSTVQELKKEIATLTATVKEQAAQIQKVSAQLEASKPAPQVVNNP
jgi:hypothetical protein